MSLRELVRSLVRRWYLVVLGLLATAGLAVAAVAVTPPSHEARAYVALMPGQATFPEGSNPFLYLGGGVTVRDVLVRVMSSEDVSEVVLAGHPGAEYAVAPDPTGGPLTMVLAIAEEPADALATTAGVLAQLQVELDALQQSRDIPVDARFTSLELAEDRTATINRSATNRAVVLAVAGGVAATVLITNWLDGFVLARRGRRRLRTAPVRSEPRSARAPGALVAPDGTATREGAPTAP